MWVAASITGVISVCTALQFYIVYILFPRKDGLDYAYLYMLIQLVEPLIICRIYFETYGYHYGDYVNCIRRQIGDYNTRLCGKINTILSTTTATTTVTTRATKLEKLKQLFKMKKIRLDKQSSEEYQRVVIAEFQCILYISVMILYPLHDIFSMEYTVVDVIRHVGLILISIFSVFEWYSLLIYIYSTIVPIRDCMDIISSEFDILEEYYVARSGGSGGIDDEIKRHLHSIQSTPLTKLYALWINKRCTSVLWFLYMHILFVFSLLLPIVNTFTTSSASINTTKLVFYVNLIIFSVMTMFNLYKCTMMYIRIRDTFYTIQYSISLVFCMMVEPPMTSRLPATAPEEGHIGGLNIVDPVYGFNIQ